ncbi:MAG: Ig-like domain-containing protein [Gemmatimonadota bacterium]|nr:Ig-like domain-containing protein [Gemmatimonadota bacterium]MDE2871750.1 Ig-like domain-containing protein [Gemmatimonadota bacterium]
MVVESSGDRSVVTVDGAGLVVAVGNGAAAIRAVADTLTASVTVTVAQRAAGIVVSPESVDLSPNSSKDLDAEVFDANGYPIPGYDFTWSSDDEGVATVSSTGLVTSKQEGTAEITAEAEDTDFKGAASILVERKEITDPREILALLYRTAGGANWTTNTNWLTDEPLGSWHGVTVDGEGRITELRLRYNGLTGEIPRDLGNLKHLKRLDLGRNGLTGTIPLELARLSELDELILFVNNLTGTIPPQLGSLAKLRYLGLSDNSLTGAIPPELGNLGRLNQLRLNNNGLSGSIPVQLGNLGSLWHLILTNNELTGAIPPELGGLSRLSLLYLGGNSLEGSIPAELGNLSRLRALHLDGNDLTGSVPSSLGGLDDLVNMDLSDNDLSGTIPAELAQMDTLLTLDLSFNELNGGDPSGVRRLRAPRVARPLQERPDRRHSGGTRRALGTHAPAPQRQ